MTENTHTHTHTLSVNLCLHHSKKYIINVRQRKIVIVKGSGFNILVSERFLGKSQSLSLKLYNDAM